MATTSDTTAHDPLDDPLEDTAGDPAALSGAPAPPNDALLIAARMIVDEMTEHDDRFRLIADSVPHMVWVSDSNGYYLYFNRRWYEYTGLPPEQSVGIGFTRALHPDDVERTLQRWRASVESGLPYEIEYRFLRHDGRPRWFVGRAVPVRDPRSGAVVLWVGTCTDIDDQKRAQAALVDSESRLSVAVEAAHMGTWEIDVATGRVQMSQRTDEILGVVPGSITTVDDWAKTLFPGDAAYVRGAVDALLTRGEPYRVEHRVLWPDGATVRWVMARGVLMHGERGEPLRAIGVVTDITDRKEAEAELARAAARQRRIAETLQRAMMSVPAEDAFPGIRIVTLYEAAWEEALVGGDFHDAYLLGPHEVALVVGDVMGKGLVAATFTAEVKYGLRAYLHEEHEPARALRRLNSLLLAREERETGTQPRYVALTAMVLDTRTGRLRFAATGAEPPMIYRAATRQVEPVTVSGTLLGAFADAEYDTVETELGPKDVLVVSTDGITEARRDGELFGWDRLADTLRQYGAKRSLRTVGESIVRTAFEFAGNQPQDDICILLARRR